MNAPRSACLLALCFTLFGPPLRGATADPPRLIVLYATCTLNKSFLSPYNPEVAYTPHLQAFSGRSKVFTKHRTEAGMSGVAYASIFSGRDTEGHGIFTHPERLDDSNYLITEAFADNGYDVYAWNAHPMASADLNYFQGVAPRNIHAEPLSRENKTFDRFQRILLRLNNEPDYRAFVLTNFTVTHAPYRDIHLKSFCDSFPEQCSILDEIPRKELRRLKRLYHDNHDQLSFNFPPTIKRLRIAPEQLAWLAAWLELLYKSNVHYLDQLFGGLIEEIEQAGMLDEALIVFTADHGESHYDKNAPFKWSHSHSLRADVLDVPLILYLPEFVDHAGTFDFVTRSVDVFPTIAGLAGISLPDDSGVTGRDLSSVVRGTEAPVSLAARSHSGILPLHVAGLPEPLVGHLKSYYPAAEAEVTWVAIREGDRVWKYKNAGAGRFIHQMFDLDADPRETTDRFLAGDPLHEKMADRLTEYKQRLLDVYDARRALNENRKMMANEEILKKLRSLGYIR